MALRRVNLEQPVGAWGAEGGVCGKGTGLYCVLRSKCKVYDPKIDKGQLTQMKGTLVRPQLAPVRKYSKLIYGLYQD